MTTKIFFLILFLSINFNAFANIKPFEAEVLKLRKTLTENTLIKKDDLEASLLLMKSKTKSIVNDVVRTDLSVDIEILLDKYVKKNKSESVKSKDIDYSMEHIIDDLKMFRKMGMID